jgi:superfamily II DNA helicase RecQ
MKYRFFNVPATAPEAAQAELNQFCNEHKVVNVDKQFVQDAGRSYWALCICYLDAEGGPLASQRDKVDYREVLNEQDFAVFAKLRNLRKVMAEKEGVPAYALFTNEQLAAMVQKRVTTKAALSNIPGIGTSRIGKYGDAFLKMLVEELQETAKPDNATATS